jgi:general secretion pathway protein D
MRKSSRQFIWAIAFNSSLLGYNISTYAQATPPPPLPPPFLKSEPRINKSNDMPPASSSSNTETSTRDSAHKNPNTMPPAAEVPAAPASSIPHGQELVSIDFPNGVNLSDIIRTVGTWIGKNFILGQGVSGTVKISIISPEPVTKEEAYQAFLSALNISGFTTVDTGKVVKILSIANARSSNIKTYYGESWAPATDEIINQVVPLHYIDATSVINQLRPMLGLTQYTAFTTTNSLILTDTGNRIRRILEVIKLLDNKTNQAQVTIVPINYMSAKDASSKVSDIFSSKNGPSLTLQKVIVDERTNSLILVGPSRGLDDVVRFIQRIDKPTFTQSSLIRVRPLDYADAEKIAQTLQALAQNTGSRSGPNNFQPPPFIAPPPNIQGAPAGAAPQAVADLSGVKITADKATNSLIIQGSKSAYEEIDDIISQLDKRRAQVYVEADIVDLAINNGLQWAPSTLGGTTLKNGYTVPFGFNAAGAVPFTVSTTNTSTDPSSLLGGGGATSAILGILSNTPVTIGGFTLTPGAILFALKNDANTNILQTPSMIVSDNETASFESNQQFSVNVNVTNPNGNGIVTQAQKYDVTTSLKVTPQVSRADFVNLKINLQLDDSGPISGGFPNPIQKRKAESVVTVQNEQTAVLGGITQDSTKIFESKVPLLGDIPILGWLFKTVNNQKNKTSLTLFVTPHIVRNSEDLAHIYEKKLQDRDAFLKVYYGNSFKEEDFYSKLPTLKQGMAPPEVESDDEDADKKKSDQTNNAPIALPSSEKNPINAPTDMGGGGRGAINQSPLISQPAITLPPPPPPAE